MDYRTILVHLDASPAAHCRLDVAVRLAAAYGARLVGLYSAVMIERHSFYGAAAGHILERQEQLDSSRDEVARHFTSATASAGGCRGRVRCSI